MLEIKDLNLRMRPNFDIIVIDLSMAFFVLKVHVYWFQFEILTDIFGQNSRCYNGPFYWANSDGVKIG